MKTAVLLMAYGSPISMEDVHPYLEGIYEGRPVPEYALKENTEKYRMVNAVSPSNAVINSVIDKLIQRFSGKNIGIFLGNKHWKPWISEVVKTISEKGYGEIIAIPMFPFPSHNVVESYSKPLNEIVERIAPQSHVSIVNGLDYSEKFYRMWASILKETEGSLSDRSQILFTAHSLPNSATDESEYDKSFSRAAARISEMAGISDYLLGYQSRGKYGNSWLGPSVYDALPSIGASGKTGVITVPIGFLYTHLEVLYDLDYEFGGTVVKSGLSYSRTALPDDRSDYINLLSDLILEKIEN
ncbi:ferrochelatase [Thermoplasmatales archaeon]|nr:ferrochelatase [Thermoplasmatales archaeon]